MLSHFIVGDPVQCAFTLQVVAETAFTNIAFVALPDVGARNGDFTLPTTYLSVQSDEARHISNGYATLLTVLQEDDNAPLIERDLAQAWWINHAYLDGFGSGIMEYGSDDRSDTESYMDKWERWIEDDWYRSYVLKLGKLGLNFDSSLFDRARDRLKRGMVHRNMIGSGAFWMLNFWRMDGLDERDFEWFEARYPGWYAEYGAVWEAFRATRHDPQQFKHLMGMALEQAVALVLGLPDGLRVRGGHVPPGGRRPHALLLLEGMPVAGRVEPRPLRRRPQLLRPLRRLGDLGAGPRTSGYVRSDGETLVPQPHVNGDRMWTLADLRSMDFHIKSPNIVTAEKLGLPNGSSVGLATPNGHIDGGLQAAAPWSKSNGHAAPASVGTAG